MRLRSQTSPTAAAVFTSFFVAALTPSCGGGGGGGSTPATPTITAPAAGAFVGGTTAVTWTGLGGNDDVLLRFSSDGGTTFPVTIATGEIDDGSFDWDTTGESDTNMAQVQVTDGDGVATSGTFTIDNTIPSTALTAPNGGELVGASATITWATTDANLGTMRIDASADGGMNYDIAVAAAAPDNGSFTWDTSALASGTTYRVQLTPTDAAGNDGVAVTSAADFEIDVTAPVITLTAPVGGESLTGATNVTWNSTEANPGTVAITASLDGGASFTETIAAAATDNGSFRWLTGTVPDSTMIRVRVVATDAVGNVSSASESGTNISSENMRITGPVHYRDTNGNGSIDSGDTLLVRFDKDVAINSPVAGDFVLPVASDTLGAGAAIIVGPETDTLVITLGTSPTLRTRAEFDAADVDAASPSGFELADPITADAIESAVGGIDAAPVGPVDVTVQPQELATVGAGANTPGRGALGDLDLDGDLDLVVAVTNSDASERWSGDGDLGLSLSQSLTTADARDVALADVDGDGDLDAVFAVFGANEVWTNDGSGALTTSAQALGSSSSTSVALGDLDGDGDVDAVFGNDSTQPDRIWINNGAGVFSDSGQTLGTTSTNDLVLADFDGDGDQDLFFGADDADSGLWTNNGAGLFSASTTLTQTAIQAVTTADFNRDGAPDVALAALGQNQVRLGDGAGGFGAAQFLGNNDNRGIQAIDLDGDGDLDIYTAKNLDSGKYFLNDGSGVFSEDTVDSVPDTATDVVVGNLDGDLDADFVVLNDMGGMRPYRGSVSGGQPAATYSVQDLTDGPWVSGAPTAGDLNGDGIVDLLVPDVGTSVRVLLGSGSGFSSGTAFGSASTREGDLVDVDGDGDLDHLQRVGALGADNDTLWLGDGAGGFTDSGLSLGLDTYAAGDLDGDGDQDLIVATATELQTWDGDGMGGFTASGQSVSASGLSAIGFGDMDSDGDIDVVYGNSTDVTVFENDGLGGFTSGATIASLTDSTALTIADFDRDGDLDITQASSAAATNLRWARNDGSLSFAAAQDAVSVQNAFERLVPVQLDEDGDLDLLAVDPVNQALFLFIGNGNGTFQSVPGAGITDLSAAVALDYDRDGDVDLYVARGNDATPGATTDQLRVLD